MLRDRILFFRRVFLTGRLGITRRKDLAESKIRYTFAPGEMAEWSIAAVLKTVELRGSGGSNPSLSANDRKVGWVANVRLQPFLFSGRDEFIRSGLKIKVGRMVRRRKSGVRRVASGPTEGRTRGMW